MNHSCDVIKDLLPLYHDGVSSEESNKIVKEHLENCGVCRDYLDGISKEIVNYNKSKEEEAKINSLIKLRKKFRIKRIIVSTVSIICAVILFFIANNFIRYYEFTVNYKDDILSSEKIYSANNIMRNSAYYCTHFIIKVVEEQPRAYIYYTNVLLDNDTAIRTRTYKDIDMSDMLKYIDATAIDDLMANKFTDSQEFLFSTISTIYYFVGDYEKLIEMPDDEFFTATKDAVLIWEK